MTWTHPLGRVFALDFSRPLVMGVLNVTPDSFSDGGKFFDPAAAVARARELALEGADILDLGAETTRPGSSPTSEEEEWRRLSPALEALSRWNECPPISVDTYKSSVASKAIAMGAAIVNDVYAGRQDPRILKVTAEAGLPIVLTHMLGEPRTMQDTPHYEDVVREVRDFLLQRAEAAMEAGIPRERIILDPGLGFGKTAAHNLALLNRMEEVRPQGFRFLMALSRKAFLGHVLDGAPPDQRDGATAVASALAVWKGAEMVRVHDVRRAVEALKVVTAIRREALA
jgi:dihydropteroate synthase